MSSEPIDWGIDWYNGFDPDEEVASYALYVAQRMARRKRKEEEDKHES